MPDEAVKVAVRVRPFNQREKDRTSKLIIKMQDQMTTIANPETPNEEPKKFSFDYSYWSHDGFTEDSAGNLLVDKAGSKYASQRRVFEDLGQGVLDNAFEGYNCSLFAYGQTGSGKSYSMVGYGPNRGIVPITCDELFQTVENNSDANRRFEVTFSMLEIYNEQVRDLLSKDNPKGTASRTVASTNMNATSSRAHTVVTITFDQIIKDSDSGSETKKSSVMNLVDLAGSERADSTGAVGDRLKEGANINKSLSALGNVISALADLSMGTKKKIVVPYRDSVLTKLLQNALGGNSKTIMIAALSPADINYDETLSTLRYADRAKKIKNKAVINENPMDKLIRELKEENERLKKSMEGGGLIGHDMGMTPEEVEKMRKQMEEEIRAQLFANQEMIAQNTQSWEEQLAAARTETENITDNSAARKAKEPHLINLNEDPMLSGVICHFLSQKETTIGRKDAKPVPSICLSGLSIQKQHSVIYNSNGTVEVESVAGTGSKTKVNGIPLQGKKVLCHKDRVLFGSNHMYVFINPMKKSEAGDDLPAEITWEFAQKEIAQVKGFATGSAGLTKDQQIAQEQVLEILPMVSEVNAVSEELDKHKSFEVVLIATAATDGSDLSNNQGTKNADQNVRVMVKMKNLLNGNTWLWERGKFMNRRYLIQELYQRFLDGEDVSKVPKEEDPFWEPTEDVLIGTANVFLQSLCYALDFDDKVLITDYKGQEEGYLYVHVTPCAANGKPLDEESFVEDPKDLLSKPYNFKVTVNKAEINKVRFSKGINVKYSVKVESKGDSVETPTMKNTLTPEFKHFKVIQITKLKKKHLEFFETKSICFHVYGTQEDTVPDPKLLKLTTRDLNHIHKENPSQLKYEELRQMDSMEHGNPQNSVRRNTIFSAETMSDQSHLKTEVVLLQRKYERLQQKERRMQQICEDWKNKPEEEKQFEPFYRTVSAVAYSTGTRLRTRVQLLNSMLHVSKTSPQLRQAEKLSRQTTDLSHLVLQGQKFVRDVQNGGKKHNSHNEDDLVSLYIFGEDEPVLAAEADKNNGVVSYHMVANHHYKDLPLSNGHQNQSTNGNKDKQKRRINSADGKPKDGSSACTLQ
ncbi:Kinesin-like protein KIF16B,Kinesin-like protein KIF17,Chromosome-associated kinesin KIF4,Kinesin-like protein KIN-12B,Chromosome-associated kinesin KIF4A,Kinesin-like protein KIF1A,Kinesin-II 95 kDa subunit,Kinesin-II 85 kDa subunit,Kinesin-like protein KIN-1,Kinesin-like protein CIN8,Kinesin-like protein unc-104,Kinesin-like protein KIF3A,Kinesin-like protein KIF13B,Kinesin-like protein KIF28P,Kinesin-like protein KIF1C,Chromosome-associated kinesin KIF4B,Kinesin-related protein 8,Kinesin-like protein KI|uniref:Kinesin motor domain-containing protein n=1 Tax=Mytilus edulis TaxID=6550 RepID=A0A8S3Q660_MYTED|nr:Kinesin-like protein KIF16B,Kinesin-like protein KIF17,Chromosome-associated kinesin KIF4,Kinesin-like protein KIN-12B,Chromosome-associated kinesin KIF4A,Kinesin-like protein KIF1A,Kinesin-II 95 kDa subunit,Kinesin-II 85 kDa subunit,Kinesin-like protein KIN-1,Kinesin-like protein CIN8,Kinesin-like protein unc-104,Kinesin-like protein KIF3A,Kinesin-like protein KIF13B,Kinesin-like protein KIF28P,Kinesin-like protein KIF1C,Chromosome-associated kinesin KIF4B,Kinesin-related protein 8,Kinesin-like